MVQFVDDIDDMEFEEFFGGRKKRQERLEKRLDRREDRKDRRGKRRDKRQEARDLRRASRQGMTLEEYYANQDLGEGSDENVESIGSSVRDGSKFNLKALNKRPMFSKRPAKVGVDSAIVDAVDEAVDEIDTELDLGVDETGSFIEKNKTYLLIGAGLVGAFVLFKMFK